MKYLTMIAFTLLAVPAQAHHVADAGLMPSHTPLYQVFGVVLAVLVLTYLARKFARA